MIARRAGARSLRGALRSQTFQNRVTKVNRGNDEESQSEGETSPRSRRKRTEALLIIGAVLATGAARSRSGSRPSLAGKGQRKRRLLPRLPADHAEEGGELAALDPIHRRYPEANGERTT